MPSQADIQALKNELLKYDIVIESGILLDALLTNALTGSVQIDGLIDRKCESLIFTNGSYIYTPPKMEQANLEKLSAYLDLSKKQSEQIKSGGSVTLSEQVYIDKLVKPCADYFNSIIDDWSSLYFLQNKSADYLGRDARRAVVEAALSVLSAINQMSSSELNPTLKKLSNMLDKLHLQLTKNFVVNDVLTSGAPLTITRSMYTELNLAEMDPFAIDAKKRREFPHLEVNYALQTKSLIEIFGLKKKIDKCQKKVAKSVAEEKLKSVMADFNEKFDRFSHIAKLSSRACTYYAKREVESIAKKYQISHIATDVLEETLLYLAGVAELPRKCHYQFGEEGRWLHVVNDGLLHLMFDGMSESSCNKLLTYLNKDEECAVGVESHARGERSYNIVIKGDVFYKKFLPVYEETLSRWAKQVPERLTGYRAASKQYFPDPVEKKPGFLSRFFGPKQQAPVKKPIVKSRRRSAHH